MAGKSLIRIALFLCFFGCKEINSNKPGREINTHEFNKIQMTDLKEKPIDLNQYSGKVIFVNFWATWCKPCIEEMPSIERAQEILQKENIVFLLASNETIEQIEGFIGAQDYKLNYVRIKNMEELNIPVLPTTFIFNLDRQLVFSEMGYRKWDDTSNINLIRNYLK